MIRRVDRIHHQESFDLAARLVERARQRRSVLQRSPRCLTQLRRQVFQSSALVLVRGHDFSLLPLAPWRPRHGVGATDRAVAITSSVAWAAASPPAARAELL